MEGRRNNKTDGEAVGGRNVVKTNKGSEVREKQKHVG